MVGTVVTVVKSGDLRATAAAMDLLFDDAFLGGSGQSFASWLSSGSVPMLGLLFLRDRCSCW